MKIQSLVAGVIVFAALSSVAEPGSARTDTITLTQPPGTDFTTGAPLTNPSMNANTIKEAQSTLATRGYNVVPTGQYDSQTIDAIKDFQADIGLEQSGTLDEATLKALNITER